MCKSFPRLGVVAHTCNSCMCQRIVPWAVCQILGNLGKGDPVLKKKSKKKPPPMGHVSQGSFMVVRGNVSRVNTDYRLESDRRLGELR